MRIAIFTDTNCYYAWQHSIVSQLKELSNVEIVLNIRRSNNIDLKVSQPFLWKMLLELDSKFFNPKPDAQTKVDAKDALKDIPSFEEIDKLEFNALDDYNLDIILNLSHYELDTNIIKSSKNGVWFLTHCDLENINRRPFGIWEMLNKEPETVAVLRYIKKNMSSPKTIAKTSSCTDGLSYKRNINSILWQAHLLVIDNIKLLAKNEDLFKSKLKKYEGVFANKKSNVPYLPPSNLRTLRFILSLYYRKIKQLVNSKLYFNQWALIFLNSKNKSSTYDLSQYQKIMPPKDRFWADPFLLKRDNKYYLFVEELIYKNKLGHLSVMEIDEDGNYTIPEKILVKDYHLSFPFIFEDKGELYMIPETSGNNDIQLYKCTEFPLKWELEKILMKNVVAVDTTIYKENDTYWMLTSIKNHKGTSKHVELFAFSSTSLINDEWQDHPLNPLVTDVKTARPAGAVFRHKGKLYRPSQNCSNYYGYGLNIIEIKKLTHNDYHEEVIHAIEPDWDKRINSTHSFNSVDNLFISDVKIRRRRFF